MQEVTLEVTQQQKVKDYELTKNALMLSQYFFLGMAVSDLLSARLGSATLTLGVALYAEKLAAKVFEQFDKAKSQFISSNYSSISKFSDLFSPAVQKVSDVVMENVNKLSQRFKR